MTDKYQLREEACQQLRTANQQLLAAFDGWLADQGISPKTIRVHVNNLDLFLNYYLLYEEPIEASRGIYHTGMFFGYWYPRKVSRSEWSLRSSAASLRRFYRFMAARGLVTDAAEKCFREQLRTSMPEWLVERRT